METIPIRYRFDAYHVLPDSLQMQKDFLYIAASLKAKSSEPTASEVVRIAQVNGVLPVEVTGFQEYPGRGLGGLVTLPNEQRPRAVIMGSREFMEQCGLQIPAILEVTTRLWEKEQDAHITLLGWDGSVRGVMKFLKEKI
jgi:cation transport ATPase